MMGIKERNFHPLPENISLEELVPKDNFYRRLQERLDLSFVREMVEGLYAASGRPSIDPEVFFRLQMVMFYEDIRSERELMRIVSDRLSARWYVGYDLFEDLPDHSSLTRIRDRYGLSVFREFFERVVELCIEAGLVWGEELYFDATKVDADASLDSVAPRFYVEEYLDELFAEEDERNLLDAEQQESITAAEGREESPMDEFYELPSADDEALIAENASKDDWISRNGRQRREQKGTWYRRKADFLASKTDPDSSLMKRRESKGSHLGYYTHYVVDGGKARIILKRLVCIVNSPSHQIRELQPRPTEMVVEPDTKVVQRHPRRQSSTQTLDLVGTLPPEAEGIEELVVDRLDDLTDGGNPSPQTLGPASLLGVSLGRVNNLRPVAFEPTLMVLGALEAFVGYVRATTERADATQPGVRSGSYGEEGLGQGLVGAGGTAEAEAGDHPRRIDCGEQGEALVPSYAVGPSDVGLPCEPSMSPALGVPYGHRRAVQGLVRTLRSLQQSYKMQDESLDEVDVRAYQAVELRTLGQGGEGIPQFGVGVAIEVPLAGETAPTGKDGQGNAPRCWRGMLWDRAFFLAAESGRSRRR